LERGVGLIILLATWGVGLSWPGVGGLTRPDAGYCVEQPEEDEDEVIRAGTGGLVGYGSGHLSAS
jgi:hypothetical protein